MTKQQIFTKVANHLMKQGKPAKEHGYCRYRTKDGKTCAIGCLIPKSRYGPFLEGLSADIPDVMRAAGLSVGQIDLARSLQIIHDEASPKRWAKELALVAEEFHLKLTPSVQKALAQ